MGNDPINDLVAAIDAHDEEAIKVAAVALASECLMLARRATAALEQLAKLTADD